MPEGSVRINGSEYHVTVKKWTAIEVYKAAGELCGLVPMKFKLYQGTAVVAANGDPFKQDAEYDLIPNGVGSVVEHYGDSFRKSQTSLRAHLKLAGVSDEDALLVPPAWVL